MNDLECRLTDLLHTGAPEPERVITANEIAELAQDGHMTNGRRLHRWGVPVLAAASVLVAVAVPVVVSRHTVSSNTPTSPSLSTSASAPTSSTPAPTSNAPGLVATCLTSQLRLTSGQSQGTVGSIYATFHLTNTAGTPCSMRGFPGVSLLDDAGKIVGQPATRDGSEGPSVRLGPNQRAQFILRVGAATRTGCDVPRPSSQVLVYPPDQTAPLRIPFSTNSCQLAVQSLRTL